MNDALAGTLQMREQFLKIGVDTAERLRSLRQSGENYPIMVMESGGLAVIWDKDKFRFSSVHDTRVAKHEVSLLEKWNRENPNHSVRKVPIQQALEAECYSILLMLSTIEQRRRALELEQ